MYTYIIESQGFIKIGRTIEMESRLKSYETHNPMFKVLKIMKEDLEQDLHYLMWDMRFKNEWFSLDEETLEFLLSEEAIKQARARKQERHERYYQDYYPKPKKKETFSDFSPLGILSTDFITA